MCTSLPRKLLPVNKMGAGSYHWHANALTKCARCKCAHTVWLGAHRQRSERRGCSCPGSRRVRTPAVERASLCRSCCTTAAPSRRMGGPVQHRQRLAPCGQDCARTTTPASSCSRCPSACCLLDLVAANMGSGNQARSHANQLQLRASHVRDYMMAFSSRKIGVHIQLQRQRDRTATLVSAPPQDSRAVALCSA